MKLKKQAPPLAAVIDIHPKSNKRKNLFMLRNQSLHIYHYILEVNHNNKYITVDIISSYHIANSQSPLFVKLLAPDYYTCYS